MAGRGGGRKFKPTKKLAAQTTKVTNRLLPFAYRAGRGAAMMAKRHKKAGGKFAEGPAAGAANFMATVQKRGIFVDRKFSHFVDTAGAEAGYSAPGGNNKNNSSNRDRPHQNVMDHFRNLPTTSSTGGHGGDFRFQFLRDPGRFHSDAAVSRWMAPSPLPGHTCYNEPAAPSTPMTVVSRWSTGGGDRSVVNNDADGAAGPSTSAAAHENDRWPAAPKFPREPPLAEIAERLTGVLPEWRSDNGQTYSARLLHRIYRRMTSINPNLVKEYEENSQNVSNSFIIGAAGAESSLEAESPFVLPVHTTTTTTTSPFFNGGAFGHFEHSQHHQQWADPGPQEMFATADPSAFRVDPASFATDPAYMADPAAFGAESSLEADGLLFLTTTTASPASGGAASHFQPNNHQHHHHHQQRWPDPVAEETLFATADPTAFKFSRRKLF